MEINKIYNTVRKILTLEVIAVLVIIYIGVIPFIAGIITIPVALLIENVDVFLHFQLINTSLRFIYILVMIILIIHDVILNIRNNK